MEEDLEEMWKKLSLTAEKEEEEVTVPKEILDEKSDWIPNCLLGSSLTARSYNKEAFKNTMTRIWRGTPLQNVSEVGENLFLFQFRTEGERQVILNGGPWNFDDNMLLKSLEPGDRPGKELLTRASFWIQIYGLPFSAMTEKMGLFMGHKLGRIREVRTDEQGMGLGKCLVIRVEVDVRKPLRRRMKILVSSEGPVMVDLKYERLLDFCYGCGIMGHKEKECAITTILRKENPNLPWQYGNWLRAPSRQRSNNSNWAESKPGRNVWRKEIPSKLQVAVNPNSGSRAGEEEARGGTRITWGEATTAKHRGLRGSLKSGREGLENMFTHVANACRPPALAGKGEGLLNQSRGCKRDEEHGKEETKGISEEIHRISYGPDQSKVQCGLAHYDNLFGEMDITVQLAQGPNFTHNQADTDLVSREAQSESPINSKSARKLVSVKRKGTVINPSNSTLVGTVKRDWEETDGEGTCSEPMLKRRTHGEIPGKLSVEAEDQPRRQQ